MDTVERLRSHQTRETVTTVDFHTAGEATRIVITGFPQLSGSLLAQRSELQMHHDHLRRRIILEPRGHWDMYGAVLVKHTEHVLNERADIGVLFMTNNGWSTMCGHATIALGRFLVDTQDETLFPNRPKLPFDQEKKRIVIRLHAPCGIVRVYVTTDKSDRKSDPAGPVEYEGVPSFATALGTTIAVPERFKWPELGDRNSVTLDFAYGGAFYGLVKATDLGFANGLDATIEGGVDVEAFRRAADAIMNIINDDSALKRSVVHSVGQADLEFLYSIIITFRPEKSRGNSEETGLCFFADSQIDRSPTGSGVQARVAQAHARKQLARHQCRTYHSLVTRHFGSSGGFEGQWVSDLQNPDATTALAERAVIVRVSGFAFYTGTSTFTFEPGDEIGKHGLSLKEVCQAAPRT